MTVQEFINKLNNVENKEMPITFMGVEGVAYLVTGTEKDFVIVEESDKTFCETFELTDIVKIEKGFAIKL
jgi:hypothetical protein